MNSVRSPHLKCYTIALCVVAGLFLFGTLAVASEIIRYDFNTVPNGSLPEGFHVHAGEWKVENGQLIGQAASLGMGQIVFGDPLWTDVEVEATVTYLETNAPARWAAIIYRAQPQGGHPYQLFTVRQGASAANGMELAHRTPIDAWDVPLKTWRSADMQLGQAYRFKIVIKGTSAKYYIDDELVLESPDLVREVQGNVGFMVDGTRVAFEDVVVRVP